MYLSLIKTYNKTGASNKHHNICFHGEIRKISGPSCSELTMSLVNDLLKFTSSDTQICWYFLLKKCEWLLQCKSYCKSYSHFFSAKATHIFSAKNIRILYTESAKTVNEITLNELVKLTRLWTTGPSNFWPYLELWYPDQTVDAEWIFYFR